MISAVNVRVQKLQNLGSTILQQCGSSFECVNLFHGIILISNSCIYRSECIPRNSFCGVLMHSYHPKRKTHLLSYVHCVDVFL